MIFLQNLFRCSPQLALSVEIGVPISLCGAPSTTAKYNTIESRH